MNARQPRTVPVVVVLSPGIHSETAFDQAYLAGVLGLPLVESADLVVRDGKADQVELTESGTTRNSWIATEGIEAGDLLVLDGLDNLRDGAEVTTVAVAIDDEGVVRDADAVAAEVLRHSAAHPETIALHRALEQEEDRLPRSDASRIDDPRA